MSKTKLYGLICIVLLISNGFLLYYVLKPHAPGGPKNLVIEKLHFDDRQVAKYELLIQEHREAIREKEGQILKLKQKLYAGLGEDAPPKTDKIIQFQLGMKQMEIEEIHYAHFLEIKDLCRPDQQVYFKRLSKELAHLFDRKPPHRK